MISLHQFTLSLTLTLLLQAAAVSTIVVVEAGIPKLRTNNNGNNNQNMPYLREQDLLKYMSSPSSTINSNNSNKNKNKNKEGQQQWMSISEDVEFMPNMNMMMPPLAPVGVGVGVAKPPTMRRKMEETWEFDEESTTGAYEEYDPYSNQPFVEGMSEYDEYQQAWRLLGFMVDCNSVTDDDANSGSGSGDVTEDGCARYVLWAAYVDLDYEGGGIGEYQYWDRESQSYNDTACYYAEGGSGSNDNNNNNGDDAAEDNSKSRCAKMDCHEPDTNWSVLGFFKHRNYDDWMEQLFKHEGMCVWNDEEYAFMKNARKAWPQGCIDSGSTVTMTEDGSSGSSEYNLYYNIKPLRNGRIDIGLYTDTQCLDDYSVTTDEMEDTIGNFFVNGDGSGSQDENYDFSSDTLSESMERWHSGFDVWHTCHPCIAHHLENLDGSKYLDDDDYYANYYNDDYYNNYNNRRRQRQRKLGGEYSAEGDIFECYDDAGYTNVNQCMKFSAKTVMKTATFRDLSLGRTQATLVEYPLSGFYDKSDVYRKDTMGNIATYLFLSTMSLALFYSLWSLYIVAKTAKAKKMEKGSDNKQDSLLVKEVEKGDDDNNNNNNNNKEDSLFEL